MKQNTQNSSDDNINIDTSPEVKRVAQILGINLSDAVAREQKEGIKSMVEEALLKDPLNREAAVIGIRKDPEFFTNISDKLREDLSILKETIKSMCRHGYDYSLVKIFIETNSKNDKIKKKLFLEYQSNLNLSGNISSSDLFRNVLTLSSTNSAFLQALQVKRVVGLKSPIKVLGQSFKNDFEQYLLSIDGYLDLDIDKQTKVKNEYLQKYIGFSLDNLNEQENIVLEGIYEIIDNSLSKLRLKVEDEELKEDKTESNIEQEPEDIKNSYESEPDFDDRLDFCYPGRTFSSIGGGYYEVSYNDLKVTFSEKEKESFTKNSLKNYLEFLEMMYDIGLGFLIKKPSYKQGILSLLNSRCDCDYLSGNGISESKRLQLLNIIGKTIGIPEYEFESSDGEKTKQVKCFDKLASAKIAFSNIKLSGLINGDRYSDLSMNSAGAVENKLSELGAINRDTGEFNSTVFA